jgi:hypothetical protein
VKRLFRLLTWIPRTLWKVLRRRYRQIALAVIVLAMIGTMGMLYYRHSVKTEGERLLAATLTKLDETEPGWRLEQQQSPTLPESENSAYLLKRIRDSLGSNRIELKGPEGKNFFEKREPNYRLIEEDFDRVEQLLQKHSKELDLAKQFLRMPRGQRLTQVLEKGKKELPEAMSINSTGTLLEAEAFYQAQNGRLGAALMSAISLVHSVNAMEGDGLLIELLIKINSLRKSSRCTEHILAMGETKSSHLIKLQSLYLESSQINLFRPAMKGERANVLDIFNENANELFDKKDNTGSLEAKFVFWNLSWHKHHSLEGILRLYTDILQLSDLPDGECREQLLKMKPPPNIMVPLPGMLFGPVRIIHDGSLRTKAILRAASTAIAVERYRMNTGRWPESLEQIPRGILPAIPEDPFDGQPLRYFISDEGPIVYSVGSNDVDDGGAIREITSGFTPDDIGFQLYHLPLRGLLPPHKPSSEDNGLPPLGMIPNDYAIPGHLVLACQVLVLMKIFSYWEALTRTANNTPPCLARSKL